MANWAIVIGISKYAAAQSLEACTNDALQFRKWLMKEANGGNVLPENILLSLAPVRSTDIPNDLKYNDAKSDDIIAIIHELIEKSGGEGDRLFFYYSGHGLSNRENFIEEDAMIGSDCTAQFPNRTLSIRSVIDYLATYQFKTQFFIIDACRDVPWPFEYRIGNWPLPRKRDLRSPPVQQFVIYGTSPGLRSYIAAGSPNSIFTQLLLEGLKGTGTAKVWDPRGRYLVRVESLFKYVSTKVYEEMKKHGDIQLPQKGGSQTSIYGDSNPILATFPPDKFLEEELIIVKLVPDNIGPQTEITIVRDNQIKSKLRPVLTLPASFKLPPREYSVIADAPGYAPVKEQWDVDLYERSEINIEFNPAPIALIIEKTFTGFVPGAKSSLEVTSNDDLAPLEIADSIGNNLQLGFGKIELSDLEPGYYRARLRTPENKIIERLIELTAGKPEQIFLEAPPPPDSTLAEDIIRITGFDIQPDKSMTVSETTPDIGAVATAEISTFLTLAGSVKLLSENEVSATRLRKLGIQSFKEKHIVDNSGIQILFGLESFSREAARDYLSKIKLRVWQQKEMIPESSINLDLHPSIDGIAELVHATAPGSYWMSFEFADKKDPTVFSVAIMAERLTMVIFHVDAQRKLRIFQYTPKIHGSDRYTPALMRRLDMVQRFYMNGSIDRAFGLIENIQEILYGKWEDPLLGLIGCYLLLKMEEQYRKEDKSRAFELLDIATSNLVDRLPATSDSYVLRAEYCARVGREVQAKEHFHSALGQGIPIFADGLQYLFFGTQQYNIEYNESIFNLREVFDKHMRSSIWTAWSPLKFVSGRVLSE